MAPELDLSAVISAAAAPRQLRGRDDLAASGWTFWELRTLNRHRAIGLWRTDRSIGDAHVLEAEMRGTMQRNFKRRWWRGFAYGCVAELGAVPWSAKDLESLVDIYENAHGVLQWVVLVARQSRSAIGVHTWMETFLTGVYGDTLQALERAGYTVTTGVRGKDGLLKFITGVSAARGVAFPEFHARA